MILWDFPLVSYLEVFHLFIKGCRNTELYNVHAYVLVLTEHDSLINTPTLLPYRENYYNSN